MARRFVRDALTRWGVDELEEPAILLTSELVTNALLHARSTAEVVLRLEGERLWVGVFDGVAVAPVRKHYGSDAATGRGLMLIERMASAWGTETSGSGKVVWFELTQGSPPPAPAMDENALLDLGAVLMDTELLDSRLLEGSRAGAEDQARGGGEPSRRRPPGGPRPFAGHRYPLRHGAVTRS